MKFTRMGLRRSFSEPKKNRWLIYTSVHVHSSKSTNVRMSHRGTPTAGTANFVMQFHGGNRSGNAYQPSAAARGCSSFGRRGALDPCNTCCRANHKHLSAGTKTRNVTTPVKLGHLAPVCRKAAKDRNERGA